MSTLYETVHAEAERYVRITKDTKLAPAAVALLAAVEGHDPTRTDGLMCPECYFEDGPCALLKVIAAKLGVEAP